MIKAVRCDQESFQDVEFTSGLNVILAERADTSTEKDSRNGLGKSTLIEIIHFCLGGATRKDGGIFSIKVLGWTYTLEMIIQGETLVVSRRTDDAKTVTVTSPFNYKTAEVDSAPDDLEDNFVGGQGSLNGIDPGQNTLSIEDWREFLGKILFGLHPDSSRTYQPTFRSLISYFIRLGKDSYTIPFEQHRKQLVA